MAKVTFNSLKLKVDNSVKEFDFNGAKIEVKQYLPIEDKNDLIQIALQKSEENGIYNETKLEMYFNLNLIYLYTNITFTEKQKEDEAKLYDLLESNGLVTSIIQNIDAKEYESLLDYLTKIKEATLKYKTTAAALLQSVIRDLPANAQAAADLVNNLSPENFENIQAMIKMAQEAGIDNEKIANISKIK